MKKFFTTFHKNRLRNSEIKSRNSLMYLSMNVNMPTPQLVKRNVYTDLSENMKKNGWVADIR
jgi:hypothetical protein